MYFSSAFVLAIASFAVAQSSSSSAAPAPSVSGSASGCGSAYDAIIASCLKTTEPVLNACATQDWKCMCSAQQQVVTCYNNCPSDPDAFGAKQKETSWCNAAKAYSTTSKTAANTGKVTANTLSTGATTSGTKASKTTNAVHSGFANASGSGASAAASQTGNAAKGITPAGALLAAGFGLAML